MLIWAKLEEVTGEARRFWWSGLRYPGCGQIEEHVSNVTSDLAGRAIEWADVGGGLVRVIVKQTILMALRSAERASRTEEKAGSRSESVFDSHLWLDVKDEWLRAPGAYKNELEGLTCVG